MNYPSEIEYRKDILLQRIDRIKRFLELLDYSRVLSSRVKKWKKELDEITPPQAFISTFGWQMYFDYKQLHPEINEQTKVEAVAERDARYGFRMIDPLEPQYAWDGNMEHPPMHTRPNTIDVNASLFEKWKYGRSPFYYVAYFQPRNTIFYSISS